MDVDVHRRVVRDGRRELAGLIERDLIDILRACLGLGRRGAAPVERAILEGDTVTGVCLLQLAAGEPIAYVRDGLMRMLDGLESGDHISLITFSTGAKVQVEAVNQLKADKFDEAKMNKLFESKEKEWVENRKFFTAKMAEFHALLNAEQRKKLAALIEDRIKACNKD